MLDHASAEERTHLQRRVVSHSLARMTLVQYIVLRTKQQEQQPRQRECVMMDATDLARRWISAELPIQRTSFQYTEPPNKVSK
jgi:hypothetical protein